MGIFGIKNPIPTPASIISTVKNIVTPVVPKTPVTPVAARQIPAVKTPITPTVVPSVKSPTSAISVGSGPSLPQSGGSILTPSYMQQIMNKYPGYMADPAQIQAAMKSMLPAYQARLGGFDSATAQAMRNKGQQQIQSQYGNALRAAMNQAGQQGIRGPASVAMQQDIRNQMGQATAGFERDLNIANWDAGRQALSDYYGAATGQGALDIGTLTALQQLQNAQTGATNYQQGLNGMTSGSSGSGFGGIWNEINPLTARLSPLAYIPGIGSRA
jgi:hypothetical protein